MRVDPSYLPPSQLNLVAPAAIPNPFFAAADPNQGHSLDAGHHGHIGSVLLARLGVRGAVSCLFNTPRTRSTVLRRALHDKADHQAQAPSTVRLDERRVIANVSYPQVLVVLDLPLVPLCLRALVPTMTQAPSVAVVLIVSRKVSCPCVTHA